MSGGSSVLTGLGVSVLLLTACGSASQTTTVVRDVDAIQVMTPEEVTAMRSTLVPTLESSVDASESSLAPGDTTALSLLCNARARADSTRKKKQSLALGQHHAQQARQRRRGAGQAALARVGREQ